MNKNKPLQLLRDGYKNQFAEFVFESEAYTDLLMELSYDFVNKEFGSDGRTYSLLRKIENNDRIAEIARMLGGNTNSARKHAESLLDIAA